jgi:hypothetical protein
MLGWQVPGLQSHMLLLRCTTLVGTCNCKE